MVIINSFDERLLDCAFCGKKFFNIPDMALVGWDNDMPIYTCMACDTASPSESTLEGFDGQVGLSQPAAR